MTTAEAQAIYDEHGSIERVAAAIGMSRNLCYGWLKEHSVVMPKRGGAVGRRWANNPEVMDRVRQRQERRQERLAAGIRPGRAVRISCREMNRPCVTHDLPGACDICHTPYHTAGIRSLLEAEEIVR